MMTVPSLPIRCLLCCLIVIAWPTVEAIGLDRPLRTLQHTSWTARDGAPEPITALAQGGDGWLWLGTTDGLYRFDGVRFDKARSTVPGALPDDKVYALFADADGGVWISWFYGNISHYRNGSARTWTPADGLPPGTMWGFARGKDGLWAAGLHGLAVFDGRAWRRVGPESGFTAQKASSVFVTADGQVAVMSEQGLFVKPPDAARFRKMKGQLDSRQPLQQSGGVTYIVEQRGIRIIDSLRNYDEPSRPWIYRQKGPVTGLMLADRAGALWYDADDAIYRNVRPERAMAPPTGHHAPDTQKFSVADGLSGPIPYALLEDADGNVWSATDRGLDRFREADVVRLPEPFHSPTRLAPTPGGGVIGQTAGQAWLLRPDGQAQRLPGFTATFVKAVPGAILSAGSRELVWRTPDGRRAMRRIALPADAGPVATLRAALEAPDGTIWISAIGGGVQKHRDGHWQRAVELPEAGRKTPRTMFADSRRRLWFGYDDGVAMLVGGRLASFGPAQGLDIGRVTTLLEYGGTVYAAGAGGLARLNGSRFEPVRAQSNVLRGIAAAVGSPEGLWLNGAAGVVLLEARSLASGRGVTTRVFDAADGLQGRASIGESDSIVRTEDGRIWISNALGAFWIDPASLRPEPAPRMATITAVEADGKAYDTGSEVRLAPSPQRLSLHYASPAMAFAARVQYRYRLVGYDRDWQPAGGTVEAVYTGLPPGSYRFLVQAINGAGVAGPTSTGLVVQVAPTLAQTVWFRTVCALFVLAALFAAHRYWLHRHARRMLVLERARSAERLRISRELHDTLLQGVQALMLRIQAVASGFPRGDPVREALDVALDTADAVMVEARDRVRDLRDAANEPPDVVALLKATIANVREETGGTTSLTVTGAVRPVPAGISGACCRIVMEALRNAHHHAGATLVEVAVRFDAASLRVVVSDNGKGIAPDIVDNGRQGHWGLAGMRERAVGAGAAFDVRSSPETGTRIAIEFQLEKAARRT